MTEQTHSFSNCPHLGLSGDAGSVFMMATPSHCCFASDDVFSPDLEYQSEYCLSQNHHLCSLVQNNAQTTTEDDSSTAPPYSGPSYSGPASTEPASTGLPPMAERSYPDFDSATTDTISTYNPDLLDPQDADTMVFRVPDFTEPPGVPGDLEPDTESRDQAPPPHSAASFANESNPTLGEMAGRSINDGYTYVGPDAGPVENSEPTTTFAHASTQTVETNDVSALRHPIMMPTKQERINFWPLLAGFTVLFGLFVLYAIFNPLDGLSVANLTVPDVDNGSASAVELLSDQAPDDDASASSSGDGAAGDAAAVNPPPTDAMQAVVNGASSSNQSVVSAAEENSSDGNNSLGSSDSTSDGASESSEPSVGIVVVTATREPTLQPTSTPVPEMTATTAATATTLPENVAVGDSEATEGTEPVAVSEAVSEGESGAAPETDGAGSGNASQPENVEPQAVANTGTEAAVTNVGTGNSTQSPTSTLVAGGRSVSIKPQFDNAGWWSSDDLERNHLGDSYLYVGRYEEREYISAIRYDLRELARGAEIHEATLQLTGLRADRLDPSVGAKWRVELISEKEFSGFSRANFITARSAAAAFLISPELDATALNEDSTFTWTLTEPMRLWLKQEIIDGARSVIVRIQADTGGSQTLFAWDTGQGPQSNGDSPWLVMQVGPAPQTPPPFSTRQFIVATATPLPKNLLTVVAVNQTATTLAQTVGTPTSVPYDIVTPTPFPQNLATVQAAAIDRGLPPVVLPTRAPASGEEQAAAAQYATAVALTTGTFTPVPTNYVTPQLIPPSPIAGNVATTVARTAEAQAQAQVQTPTPLPYNAIIAEYLIATTLPENAATAQAQQVIAQAMAQTTGTATPLPWHVIVVSPTPTPLPTLPPTVTPTPFLFNADSFEPTPLPQPPAAEAVPDALPGQLRRKILFKSDRVNGQVEILALDPGSGQTFVVNLPWAHDVARRNLTGAPDGQRAAIVSTLSGEPRIKVVRFENNEAREISGVDVPGYDPAWSPSGGLIAYVSHASGGDEIYVMNEDGSNQRPLTNSPSHEVKHPTWFNGQIVFHSNQTGRRQLWIMNTNGSDARILSGSEANDFEPIYVP